jgi:hypothetical protein
VKFLSLDFGTNRGFKNRVNAGSGHWRLFPQRPMPLFSACVLSMPATSVEHQSEERAMMIRNAFQNWLRKTKMSFAKESGSSRGERKREARRAGLEQLEDRRVMTADYRTYDGTGNNLVNLQWGSTDEQLLRIVPADYADGISSPGGENRLSAREISNIVVDHAEDDVKNDRFLAAMVYVWGQFIDHDLDLTVSASPRESFPIAIPTGDAEFDPLSTGTKTMSLSRSAYDSTSGSSTSNPRQQVNTISAFLDGSMVYGSDATRAEGLRSFTGGHLKTSDGNMLPLNTAGLANENATHITPDNELFLAGDVRANENIELTSLHTLFVREHNRVADALANANPTWNDEKLYQEARKYVIAEIQSITYNEFLPALLGQNAMKEYRGYNSRVNAGIANEFSTAAFRVGHTMLGNDIEFLDNDENEVHEEVGLFESFFNPNLLKETGIDPVLKYLATDLAEEIDVQVVDSLRNQLFGPPGSGGLDLAALNIQRGRDHGLASYNETRVKYGLPAVKSFAEITSDVDVQEKMKASYGTVDDIDLWVGGIAEDHVPGSSLGPTFSRIIADQFERTRAGDRYWFENTFKGAKLKALQNTTLADVIKRNTTVTNLQPEAFLYGSQINGRVVVDMNKDKLPQPVEPGVGGLTLNLIDANGDVVATVKTNPRGEYSFKGLENGVYRVQEVLAAGVTRAAVTSKPITIDAREEINGVTLAVPSLATPTTPPALQKPQTPPPPPPKGAMPPKESLPPAQPPANAPTGGTQPQRRPMGGPQQPSHGAPTKPQVAMTQANQAAASATQGSTTSSTQSTTKPTALQNVPAKPVTTGSSTATSNTISVAATNPNSSKPAAPPLAKSGTPPKLGMDLTVLGGGIAKK